LNDLLRDAYAVLLPAFDGLELNDNVLRYLDNGGVSVLVGESREEYVGRAMSADRRASETAEAFISLTRTARERAGSNVLVAIDQELAGIQRLHDLVPALPSLAESLDLSSDEIVHRSTVVGQAARLLGVNVFLAPIVDVVMGPNPWLHNRNLGKNPAEVSRLACSFVRGVQAAGIAATAKHFPGHPVTELDPALYEAVVTGTLEALKPSLNVFRDLIASGVKAVMTGPALVPALDATQPSSTSRDTVALLRGELGFKGLVISDDIDAPGILRGRAIDATAVASLAAGADLLLLSSEAGLDRIAQAIVDAVKSGAIEHARLTEAASRVRTLASELSAGSLVGGTFSQAKD
jgi:beta-N-acetylhexosaminidase